MRAFDSSMGRLAIAVVTAAIGLEAMRSQSEFWLGVLATLTATWLVYALATAIAEPGPRRASCLAFAVATLMCVFLGEGPWSDVSFRGNVSDSRFVQRVVDDGLPTTRFFLAFGRHYVKPHGRGTIVMGDESGRPSIELVLSNRRGRMGDLEGLTSDLETALLVNMRFYSAMRPGYPNQIQARFDTLDVYFHAAYLLLSLATGALAGSLVLLFRRARRGQHAGGRPLLGQAPHIRGASTDVREASS